MAKNQKWEVDIYGENHTVEYVPRTLFSKAQIIINGKEYPLLSAKLFGGSSEVFRLGGERAIITIDADKKATLTLDGEVLTEI